MDLYSPDNPCPDGLTVESLRWAAQHLLAELEAGRFIRFAVYPDPPDPHDYIIGGLRPANPRERDMLKRT